ncbi:hypothetical protein K5I29_09905 [Flavobacterium agricola]|uniref:Lipoprotein n=1 Tax=Flavobacterium agricola TaxID=2870839 RepID=A0ABY6M120_9FLAO|nr:hypothetical protein [Flavobacterium agricola]UYW00816.1 hypothetical protein K5I29_09905 [Flavobacterium agricola]
MKKIILSLATSAFVLVSCNSQKTAQAEANNQTASSSNTKGADRAEADWQKGLRKAKADLRVATQNLEQAKAKHDQAAEKIANQAYVQAQLDFENALLARKREQFLLESEWRNNMHKAKADLQRTTHNLERAKANHDKKVEADAQIAYDAAHEAFEKAVAVRKAHNQRVEKDLHLTTRHAEYKLFKVEKDLAEAKKKQNAEAEKVAQAAYDKAIKELEEVNATTTRLINESKARTK